MAYCLESLPHQWRSVGQVMGIRGDQMNHVLPKEPATEPARLRSKVAGDASGCDLNQAALLDPRAKKLRVLLKMIVSLGV